MDELGSFRGCFEFFFLGNLKEKYSGPYNLVAPENITNKQFHQLLSEKTPSIKILSTPSFILKMTLGTRSSLLLKSPNVRSKKLSKVDFHFKFPNISSTLKDLLHERKVISAHYLSIKQWVPVPLDKVWTFFSSIHNLEKITPPWLSFKIKTDFSQEIDKGTRILYSLKIHGIPFSWQSKISNWNPKRNFSDKQEKGPYKYWSHSHNFKEVSGGTLIEDRIEYKMPFYPIGEIALLFVKKDLTKIFLYRKEKISLFLCNDE